MKEVERFGGGSRMGGARKISEEYLSIQTKGLLDSLSSNPGSEFQFATECVDVFRNFIKYYGPEEVVRNSLFLRLYQSYVQAIGRYNGRIDFSKIERSFSRIIANSKVNLDDLASSVSLQTSSVNGVSKTVKEKKGGRRITSSTFTPEYLRKLDSRKEEKERKAMEPTLIDGRNGGRVIINKVERSSFNDEEKDFVEEIRLWNYTFVYKSLARVKGLYNVLSGIYEDCKFSEDGEFNERFFESWLDFRKEVVFLRKWLEHNRGIKSFAKIDRRKYRTLLNEVAENINRYERSPQQLFEMTENPQTFPLFELDDLSLEDPTCLQ